MLVSLMATGSFISIEKIRIIESPKASLNLTFYRAQIFTWRSCSDKSLNLKQVATTCLGFGLGLAEIMKRDIREAMRNAMSGWQLILELPCFRIEEAVWGRSYGGVGRCELPK